MSEYPLIQLEQVHKRFGAVSVLEHMDLTVQAGERVALIGPSGSGKSTLLRLLMTLEAPTQGSIRIDGASLWGPPDQPALLDHAARQQQSRLRRRMGMVFQHFHLFPHLCVVDNIALAPRLVLGQSAEEARDVALRLLDRVSLRDKAEVWPAQLSGGQKQRVAIARALALEPDIMLFDEATSALDPELVGEVLAVIKDLCAQSAMTMLFVTHQLHIIEHIAGRVLMLDGGRIVESGSPEQVLHSPQHARTQAFIAALELSE